MLTVTVMGIWLYVAEPEPKGFLIIGADIVSRSIAKELQENGFRVLLADQHWDHIKTAKMEGLAMLSRNMLRGISA